MEPPDPFDELRALDPADAEHLDPQLTAKAQRTLEEILRSEKSRWSISRGGQRRRTYAVAVAISSIAAATAAILVLATRPATRATTVRCYQRADLRASAVKVAVHGSPIETCRRVWEQGQLGRLAPAGLQACKLPSGSPAVFPGRPDLCRKLHLGRVAGPGR